MKAPTGGASGTALAFFLEGRSLATAATPNRPTQQDRFRKIILAIQKYLSQLTQIILAGVTFTPASLVQFFNDQVKLLDDATAARAALRQAAQAIKENKATKGPVLRAFNDFVLSMFVNLEARAEQALEPLGPSAALGRVRDATKKGAVR